MLDKSFAEIPSKKEPFKGHTVTSLMVAGGLMQPSYVVLDRCLIVADSREQIEAILAPGENRLRRDRDFQKVDPDMFGPGNLALFARTAQLNDGLQQFVSWLGTLIAIRDYQAGAKSKVIIDKVVLPLLDGLKMYKAKGIRGYHRKDSLILESNVLIENS